MWIDRDHFDVINDICNDLEKKLQIIKNYKSIKRLNNYDKS